MPDGAATPRSGTIYETITESEHLTGSLSTMVDRFRELVSGLEDDFALTLLSENSTEIVKEKDKDEVKKTGNNIFLVIGICIAIIIIYKFFILKK